MAQPSGSSSSSSSAAIWVHVKAFALALTGWYLIYQSYVGLLTIWKIQTPPDIPDTHPVAKLRDPTVDEIDWAVEDRLDELGRELLETSVEKPPFYAVPVPRDGDEDNYLPQPVTFWDRSGEILRSGEQDLEMGREVLRNLVAALNESKSQHEIMLKHRADIGNRQRRLQRLPQFDESITAMKKRRKEATSMAGEETTPSPPVSLDQLLLLFRNADPDLSAFDTEAMVRNQFQLARRELSALAERRDGMDWENVTEIFRSNRQIFTIRNDDDDHYESALASLEECISEKKVKKKARPPEGFVEELYRYATVREVSAKFDEMRSWMDERKRQRPFPVVGNGTIQAIEQSVSKQMDDIIAELQQELLQASPDGYSTHALEDDDEDYEDEYDDEDAYRVEDGDDDEEGTCFQPEQVLPWLEAGLDAVYKKKDLRWALLRSLALQAIDTSNIILDADLGSSGSSANDADEDDGRSRSRSRRQEDLATVNLRALMDTPLLQRTADWIDRVVDLAGGYNDRLDQMIDAWMDGDEEIGKRVVSKILKAAGQVDVPVPEAVLRSKVGRRWIP